MEVLHEAENPGPLVAGCLFEALPCTRAIQRVADLVTLHARMRQLALVALKPVCRKGRVRQKPEASDPDARSHGTFDYEKPCGVYQ